MKKKNVPVDAERNAAVELEIDRIYEAGELVGVTCSELKAMIAKALPGSITREALVRINAMTVS